MASNPQDKWHGRFMAIARAVASWSKDPQAQVGAVVVGPNRRSMSWGFNGFPAGVADDDRLWHEDKNEWMVHAELNSILNARRDLTGWTLYCTKFPCSHCALAIVQAGIVRVVTYPMAKTPSKWTESHLRSMEVFKEAGVELIIHHDRAQEPEELDNTGDSE